MPYAAHSAACIVRDGWDALGGSWDGSTSEVADLKADGSYRAGARSGRIGSGCDRGRPAHQQVSEANRVTEMPRERATVLA